MKAFVTAITLVATFATSPTWGNSFQVEESGPICSMSLWKGFDRNLTRSAEISLIIDNKIDHMIASESMTTKEFSELKNWKFLLQHVDEQWEEYHAEIKNLNCEDFK